MKNTLGGVPTCSDKNWIGGLAGAVQVRDESKSDQLLRAHPRKVVGLRPALPAIATNR